MLLVVLPSVSLPLVESSAQVLLHSARFQPVLCPAIPPHARAGQTLFCALCAARGVCLSRVRCLAVGCGRAFWWGGKRFRRSIWRGVWRPRSSRWFRRLRAVLSSGWCVRGSCRNWVWCFWAVFRRWCVWSNLCTCLWRLWCIFVGCGQHWIWGGCLWWRGGVWCAQASFWRCCCAVWRCNICASIRGNSSPGIWWWGVRRFVGG